MRSRAVAAIIIFLLIIPGVSHGQGKQSADTLSAGSMPAQSDSSTAQSFDLLLLQMYNRKQPATSLSFYSRPDFNTQMLLRYEIYRASVYECALRGAGAGMSIGMAAGAFGMMTGAWDERRAWTIAGAAAAVGALFGTAKSDDPKWSIRVRLDPDR